MDATSATGAELVKRCGYIFFAFGLHVPRFFNEIQLSTTGSHPMVPMLTRVQLSPFAKTYHSFPRRHFQHDLISYLKLKRFSSYIGIALLTITGGLDMALDLNYSLGCLVDDLWALD
ncbi:hypothetical protein Tco_1184418 [Tanacetum coccineum]